MTFKSGCYQSHPTSHHLMSVPLAGLQQCDLLTSLVPAAWHCTRFSHPWLCDQLIHLSLKSYCEIPRCVQGCYDCLHWWKLRVQKTGELGVWWTLTSPNRLLRWKQTLMRERREKRIFLSFKLLPLTELRGPCVGLQMIPPRCSLSSAQEE